MRRNKIFFKKAVALLLSVLMLATSLNALLAVAQTTEHVVSLSDEPTDDKWTGTTGGLVANNYELNAYEKAILACSGLVGETYSVSVPTDSTTGLVSVDADTQTVTAKAYEADGFVWEPTAAVVKYNNADGTQGTDIKVTLSKVGDEYVGRFTKPANSYRVEVTYSLYIPVDADLQKLLLDTPYYLADGYSMTNSAAISLGFAVNAIQDKMEELRTLYNGVKYEASYEGKIIYSCTIALPNGKCKEAIGNIIADYDNGGGQMTLAKDLSDYDASSSKVKFMMEKGAAFKDNIGWFYDQIAAINTNKADLIDVAEQLENLANGTGDGTIYAAKDELGKKVEEGVQKIIDAAIKKANDDYGIDISSLDGKTRENDAIYNEIEKQREEFEKYAQTADALAENYENAATKFENLGNSAQAENYRKMAADYREKANAIRTTGIGALDTLESKIREAYQFGDDKAAELDGMKQVALDKAADIRGIVNGQTNIGSVVTFVRNFNKQKWEYIGKELVKDDITDDEYAELDETVMAAVDVNGDSLAEEHSDLDIKEKLLAAETVISAMVDQYVVYVDVKANVVPKSSVDSDTTVSLAVVSTSFPLDKNTSAEDILAAITASGTENSALTQWDSYYNIGADKYNRIVTIQDKNGASIDKLGALNGDIRYTITYSPKTFKIRETYKADGSQITEVPYGYNWRLPRPAETTKSYDYEVNGVPHRENTVIRIVDDIEVSRTEGKVISSKTLAEVVADSKVPGTALSDKEKNVLNSNAFLVDTIYFRTPDSNDNLTEVTATQSGYKLVAQSMSAGLVNSDAEWIPVKAYPVLAGGNGEEIAITEKDGAYVGEFTCDEMFSSVQVVYQLSIEGLDADTISALANMANDLVEDTAAQTETLDTLCNKNNFYENLGQVNKTILGTLGSVVKNMSTEAKNAIDVLTKECIDPATEKTYLYGYLTQYKSENGGIAYYYKGNNAQNIKAQIDLVNTYLPIVWNDPEVRAAASEYAAGAVAKVDSVLAQLKAVNLRPVNALVNTNSSFIDNMLAAVSASGTTSEHNNVTGTVVMEEILSAVAPGQTSYGVEIQVLNKYDGLVKTYKKESFRQQGATVTVAEFETMYQELLAQISNNEYYIADKKLPTADVTLSNNSAIYTSALRPMTYTVKIDGEADQILYAFDAYTITLPGTGNAGYKYVYNIGSSKVEVSSGALENFALATSIEVLANMFDANRELVITRELIDVNKDNLLAFVSNFNKAFAEAGFTFGNNLAAAFIPMEDANGNLAIVLRVTSNYRSLQPKSLAAQMMTLIQDLSYVGINGSPLFGLNSDNELKLYVQTIINMLVNSGLGIDTFSNIIDAKGNIKEMKLDGMSAVGATDNVIVVGNGKVINDVDALGGKLIESTMQFGVNINNATSVPFYVTYQDFDTQADMLAKVKKGAEQILPYVNISCKDGAANITLNAPDSVYAYMMTAMLITGQVDFSTIQSYELDKILDYLTDLIKPVFKDEGTDFDTFINTVKKTGFFESIDNFDTDANRALVEFIYNSIDNLFDNTSSTGSSEGALYTGVLTYDALDVLFNNKVALAEYKDMVAEVETGLSLPITFKLGNRATNYEALVLDIHGDGITNKYYMSRKATDAIKKAKDGAVVILLSNVRGDVVFNNDVTLNLNGYSITGDLTAKGRAVIIDSTLATKKCGSIIGELKVDGGSYKIGGGKFLTDISEYLEDGYYLKDSVVSNGCFNITTSGQNINIYLGTDYASLDKSATKVMATDLIAKLIMNFYACSELRVDANGIYETNLINVTESLDDLSVLLNKIIECIDCAGSSAFATQFMADVTNFASLADAIDNEEALISYTIQQSIFDPYMQYEEDNYFSFNVKSSDAKKIYKISVFVSDEVDLTHKDKMSAVLRELDKITTFNELKVDITDITYGEQGFGMEGAASADILVDLSTNVDYPVIIAALLAYDTSGAYRTEIVDSIKTYQTTNSSKALMGVLESMSTADLMSALKNTKSKSFASILSSLGLSSESAVELESLYTIARKVAGTIVEYSKKNGNNKTLGGLKVQGEFGTYAYRLDVSADTYANLTLKLFSEEKAITVKDKNGIIYVNTDDLSVALDSIKAGCTIYVNDSVKLTESVTLPAVSFKISGADKINFNGNKLWFADNKTVLTTDMDISAYVACDATLFCSSVEYTKDGEWFVFTLNGEQHEWEDIPAVDATCGVPGSTAGVWCKHCHKYQDGKQPEEIPALVHKYTSVVTAPTCFDEGYTTFTCDNCGDSYVNDYVDATNHVGTTVIVPGRPASCTENGLTEGAHCTACGTVFQVQTEIIGKHVPVAIPDKEVTCTEDGLVGATKCDVCGITLNEGTVIPHPGHDTEIIPGKAASCTEDGLTDGEKCKVCGEIVKEQTVIPAAHTTKVYEKAPTCTEPGIAGASVCEVCGETIVGGTVVPATGHSGEVIPGKAASCTEDGLTDGEKCKVCGVIIKEQEVIPAHHTIVPYEVAPTCTEPGWSAGSKCSVCGEILNKGTIILPTGHNVTITEGKPATCTENGYTASAYCSVCNYVHVSSTIIVAKGHTRVYVDGKAPTCTELGYTASSYCSVCHEVFEAQQPIDNTGHTPEVVPGKDATVDETGLTEGSKCSVCGETIVAQKEIAKLPFIHKPVPNVTTDGSIRGAKVNEETKQLFLDVTPTGFTVAEIADVYFKIDNATVTNTSVYNYNGSVKRGDSDLVCNGDTVVVWAKNADGVETSVTYNIIIMGDINGDGKANSRDTVLIKLAFMDQITLNDLAITAADVNFDGRMNSRDAVIIKTKYLLWPENEYVSQTK